MTYLTHSSTETEQIGFSFSQQLEHLGLTDGIVLIDGDMGAGKTAFVRGMCSFFGFSRVKSPTYSIVNEYKTTSLNIFHFDFYRITDDAETDSIGLNDYLYQPGLKLCEWPRLIDHNDPAIIAAVKIERMDAENDRTIRIDLIRGKEFELDCFSSGKHSQDSSGGIVP